MRSTLLVLLSLMVAISLRAQSLTIGNDVTATTPDSGFPPPRTTIDLANPATATGTVSSVKYSWSTGGCANAFMIKFFRRSGVKYTMTEERGPFNSSTVGTLTLTPPVGVLQGDLIGVTRLTACGTPLVSSVASDGFLVFPGNITGDVSIGDAYGRGMSTLAVYGSGSATEAVQGVIAVAGSTRGGFGSNFKTALHLFNPNGLGTITGKMVFRPQGTTYGGASLPYLLGPGEIKAYDDVVAAMGQSGLGSLDLLVPGGQGAPIVASRVYNDAGTAGTSGLSQDLIACDETLKGMARVLRRGTTGFLFTPHDPAITRFNIGVRTLYSGATLRVTLKNASGATVRTVNKTYDPNWFEQVDAATFLGGPIYGNESIEISVTIGSAIVYGATTDNVTNDPSVQFAVVYFSTS